MLDEKNTTKGDKRLDINFRCFLPKLSESQQRAIDDLAQKSLENMTRIMETAAGYRATGKIVIKDGRAVIEDEKIISFEVVNGDLAK